MKKSSLLILIFTVAISNKINAQNISEEKYQNQLIKEDFNQKVNNFKIVTNSDNYFILDNGESYTAEFRVSSVFLVGHETPTTASVIAGMTGINAAALLTNWSGTSGVG